MGPTIVIDIDGTITDLSFLKNKKRSNIINIKMEDIKSELVRRIIFPFLKFFTSHYIVRDDASEVINYFKNNGCKIIIMTRRLFATEEHSKEGFIIRELTKELLNEVGIPYDEIIFTDGNKLEECEKINPDVVIEDTPANIKAISKKYPVLCMHAPYNQFLEGDNIRRVYSWGHVKTIVDNLYMPQRTIRPINKRDTD